MRPGHDGHDDPLGADAAQGGGASPRGGAGGEHVVDEHHRYMAEVGTRHRPDRPFEVARPLTARRARLGRGRAQATQDRPEPRARSADADGGLRQSSGVIAAASTSSAGVRRGRHDVPARLVVGQPPRHAFAEGGAQGVEQRMVGAVLARSHEAPETASVGSERDQRRETIDGQGRSRSRIFRRHPPSPTGRARADPTGRASSAGRTRQESAPERQPMHGPSMTARPRTVAGRRACAQRGSACGLPSS
jgi:hypothetical protein